MNYRSCMMLFSTSLVLVIAALAEPSKLLVGNAGWGLLFDGLDDIVLLDNMPAPPFTIEFWAQPLDLKDGGGRALASYNANAAMVSRVTPTGLILSILELGAEIHTSTATVDSFGSPPAPGEIFHWAMSLDKDGDYAVYINGDGVAAGILAEEDMRAITDEYMAFPWTLGGRFGRYLGQYVTDDRAFGGVMDEIRAWSCVRSPAEIRDNRFLHNLEGPAAANLTLHLGFDMPDDARPLKVDFIGLKWAV
ncbi:m002L, partial [Symbiodinium sp. KB8]